MGQHKNYPHLIWRPAFDIAVSYLVIGLAIFLTFQSYYFYPFALLIIANRILTLSLISHEALHGTLFKNKFLNNFVGRWFCAFPTFISLTKYRKLHLLHHRSIAHEVADPDYHLYSGYPLQTKVSFIFKGFWRILTLQTSWKFIQYYTEIPNFINAKEGFWKKLEKNKLSGDFREFLLFYIVLFSLLIYFGIYHYYILFFTIPLLFITQPYVLLMGGLQHGPIQNAKTPELLSRSIRGPKMLMEILLPLNINYHAEHHLDSTVPHYWLKSFAKDLEGKGNFVWKSSYREAVEHLFSKKSI